MSYICVRKESDLRLALDVIKGNSEKYYKELIGDLTHRLAFSADRKKPRPLKSPIICHCNEEMIEVLL